MAANGAASDKNKMYEMVACFRLQRWSHLFNIYGCLLAGPKVKAAKVRSEEEVGSESLENSIRLALFYGKPLVH